MNTKPSSNSKAKYKSWTEEMFQEQKALFREKKLKGSYGAILELEDLMRKNMMEQIVGGKALVIGSQGHSHKCEKSYLSSYIYTVENCVRPVIF